MLLKKIFIVLLVIFFNLIFITPVQAIKIGLQERIKVTTLATSHSGIIVDLNTGRHIGKISGMKPYKVKVENKNIFIFHNNKYNKLNTDKIKIYSPNGFVSVKRNWYRGSLLVIAKNNNLTVINDVKLEEYIMGVVPSEMPSRWNIEAHKAQAIAARSYALANLNKHLSKGYNLKDTTEDQAYRGASAESGKTNKAVSDTYGIIMTYNKKVIPAYYCASAGGITKNSGDVWNQDLPYLHSVPSFDHGLSKNGHGVGMSQHGANNLAAKGYNAYQILTYFYNNIHFARIKPEWNL